MVRAWIPALSLVAMLFLFGNGVACAVEAEGLMGIVLCGLGVCDELCCLIMFLCDVFFVSFCFISFR